MEDTDMKIEIVLINYNKNEKENTLIVATKPKNREPELINILTGKDADLLYRKLMGDGVKLESGNRLVSKGFLPTTHAPFLLVGDMTQNDGIKTLNRIVDDTVMDIWNSLIVTK